MKKILTWILSIAMVLTMMPVMGAQAKDPVRVIKLDKDMTLTEPVMVEKLGKNVVLDLNGYKIEGDFDCQGLCIVDNGAGLTIKDSSPLGTGKITSKGTKDVSSLACVKNGSLTVNGGTFENEKDDALWLMDKGGGTLSRGDALGSDELAEGVPGVPARQPVPVRGEGRLHHEGLRNLRPCAQRRKAARLDRVPEGESDEHVAVRRHLARRGRSPDRGPAGRAARSGAQGRFGSGRVPLQDSRVRRPQRRSAALALDGGRARRLGGGAAGGTASEGGNGEPLVQYAG